ncbi:MAG: hypothetical protein HYR73_04940 [Candidatus Eisenbacteria bacterium]|nr:hypothetical protein [Candidatus Eisenbacteria bacterium]
MKRKIGVAALLGLLLAGALTTSAQAQCGTGPMIIFNTNSFAYEVPTPVTSPYLSPAGNSLTVVGLVQKFCAPFLDLNPVILVSGTSPDTEFTFVFSGLTSGGTSTATVGSTKIYTTVYSSAGFEIWRDGPPRDAPQTAAAMPGGPPAGAVPGAYKNGTKILSGTLANFTVQVTKTGTNNPNGSYRGDATFTGGTLYSRVQNTGSTLVHGNWCVFGCLPPAGGYSAQVDGKFDTPATPAHSSTWGAIKQLYR